MLSIIIAAVVVLLDQLSKIEILDFLKVSDMTVSGNSVSIINGILNFSYVPNYGAGFGILADKRWVFMLITSVVIIAILYLIFRYRGRSRLLDVVLGLILGGGIGNMIDRIRLGFVIDFIDFCAFDFWKWVFNIADSAVTVGAILFFIYLLFFDKIFYQKKTKDGADSELK